jgi:hypothetical protein
MNQSEFKAARSLNRLELRNAFKKGRKAFGDSLNAQSNLMCRCTPLIPMPPSLNIYFFKIDRLGYAFNHSDMTYSKKAS